MDECKTLPAVLHQVPAAAAQSLVPIARTRQRTLCHATLKDSKCVSTTRRSRVDDAAGKGLAYIARAGRGIGCHEGSERGVGRSLGCQFTDVTQEGFKTRVGHVASPTAALFVWKVRV